LLPIELIFSSPHASRARAEGSFFGQDAEETELSFRW